MPGKILNVAVLGIGFSANVFHIPFIVRTCEGASLVSVFLTVAPQLSLPELYKLHTIYERRATPTESKARDKYGNLGVKVVSTLDEVLADAEIDLVSHRHLSYLEAGLKCQ